MEYRTMINGIEISASYPERSINEFFRPLMDSLVTLQREKQRRILVMLAAPPAAGKSTLCKFLAEHLGNLTVLGMDGFHRRQEELLARTVMRDGQEVQMVKIKGAPVTFDLSKLTRYVQRAAAGEEFGWPLYDRLLHNPVEDAVRVTGDIVMLEGNYLLLNQPGWQELRQYADFTIRILADESILRDRLIARKIASGASPEEAVQFVEFSDLPNARLCNAESGKADLMLRLLESGEYVVDSD